GAAFEVVGCHIDAVCVHSERRVIDKPAAATDVSGEGDGLPGSQWIGGFAAGEHHAVVDVLGRERGGDPAVLVRIVEDSLVKCAQPTDSGAGIDASIEPELSARGSFQQRAV